MSAFEPAEAKWLERFALLRNVVRQEVVARQLAEHLDDGARVLDVGCGSGTQALRLLERGCTVVGVDPSTDLLDRFRHDAEAAGVAPELHLGELADLDRLLGERTFDLVCAHGLLMYLPDRLAALTALAARLGEGSCLSVTVRNGDALALRPALRGDWAGALSAFDDRSYVNELGVLAVADRRVDVEADLADLGLELVAWYGVRVLTDAVAPDTPAPTGADRAQLLDVEEQAGRRDPYRALGSQLHFIARRPAS